VGLTVPSEMNNSRPICALVLPAAMRRSTSISRGEPGRPYALDEPRGDALGDVPAARRPGGQGAVHVAVHVLVALEAGQDYHAGVRELGADGGARLGGAAHAGHALVEQRDVEPVPPVLLHGLVAFGGERDHHEPRPATTGVPCWPPFCM